MRFMISENPPTCIPIDMYANNKKDVYMASAIKSGDAPISMYIVMIFQDMVPAFPEQTSEVAT